MQVDPVTGVLKRDGADTKMNPYDLYALEVGLELKEQYGGRVSVLTMGPPQAKAVLDKIADKLHATGVQVEENVAKVSAVGAGMLGNPGIASRVFGALANAGINIDIISTSEISISCLVRGDQMKAAANAIHDEFFPKN